VVVELAVWVANQLTRPRINWVVAELHVRLLNVRLRISSQVSIILVSIRLPSHSPFKVGSNI
jgi:hypothetical protein